MALKLLERRLGSLTFAASGTSTLDLPRNYAYKGLHLRLTADITVAGGAASGVVKDTAGAQLVKRITIRANGRDVLKSIDFETLHRLTQIRSGTRPEATVMATGDIQANTLINISAFLPFEMWRATQPIDSLLNSKPLTTLEFIVDWGAAKDWVDATNDRTVTINSAALEIQAEEYVGVGAEQKFSVNKESSSEPEVTATAAEFQIKLAVGNIYRAIALVARVDGKLSNSIINNIQIKSGTEVFKNVKANHLRDSNKRRYGLETWPTGYHVLEFVTDGLLSEALDTRNFGDNLEIILDVTKVAGTNKVHVYPVELILPPVEAPAR